MRDSFNDNMLYFLIEEGKIKCIIFSKQKYTIKLKILNHRRNMKQNNLMEFFK